MTLTTNEPAELEAGSRLAAFSRAASRTDDVTRRGPYGYKNVMTKDAFSLPHLLRGELMSVFGGPWESEAIGSGKTCSAGAALGGFILAVSPRGESYLNLAALGFELCPGCEAYPPHPPPLSPAGMAPC